MGELTARVLDQINNAKQFEDLDDCIWIAGDLMRKAAVPAFHSGFEEIDREAVNDDERRQLREAILNALPRNSDPRFVGSLLSALSNALDRDLVPLWTAYLATYLGQLKGSNAIIHSVLIALNDVGELVREIGPSGRSLMDVERNIKDADAYLLERGIRVPW